jgi:hypothetical protein
MKKDPNRYPPGLNAAKIRKIIDYYDKQSSEEAAQEILKAPLATDMAWIQVPVKLIPQIQKLLGKRRSA